MSIPVSRERWMYAMKKVLYRLSASAEIQLQYLEELGVQGSIDELGLEFDDVWQVLRPLLAVEDDSVQRCLDILDEAISSDQVVWDEEALRQDVAWRRIRILAGEALRAMEAYQDPAG